MDGCREYQTIIGTYVDGTASEAEVALLRAHLEECAACAREVRELLRVRGLVSGLPTLRPSPSLAPAVAARLRAQRLSWLERLFGGLRPAEFRLAAVVAMALIVCIGVGVFVVNHPRPTVQPAASVAAPVGATAATGATDEYLQSCRLSHGTLDQDRAYWSPDAVQLASYGQ